MKKKVCFFNIDWDIIQFMDVEKIDLPNDIAIIVDISSVEIETKGADLLLDKFGYYVNKFDYKIEDYIEILE